MISRRRTPTLIALAFLAGPGAWAHPVVEHTFSRDATRSAAAFEVEAASFKLAGAGGNYTTMALRGDLALTQELAVTLRAPFHVLRLDGRAARSGPGDVDAGFRLRALSSPGSFSITVGLAMTAPLGDAEAGLGAGHVALSPLLSSTLRAGPLMLHATVADGVALSAHDTHQITFVSPHSDHELGYRAGACFTVWRSTFDLAMNGVTVLQDEGRGDTLLVLAPQMTLTLGSFRIIKTMQLPVTRDRRFDWKAALAAEATF